MTHRLRRLEARKHVAAARELERLANTLPTRQRLDVLHSARVRLAQAFAHDDHETWQALGECGWFQNTTERLDYELDVICALAPVQA